MGQGFDRVPGDAMTPAQYERSLLMMENRSLCNGHFPPGQFSAWSVLLMVFISQWGNRAIRRLSGLNSFSVVWFFLFIFLTTSAVCSFLRENHFVPIKVNKANGQLLAGAYVLLISCIMLVATQARSTRN